MKKILMIGTGGTIASKETEDGLTPGLTPEDILYYIPDVKNICDVADNKSVIAVIILLYSLHNQLPMLRLYVRAVQIAHLDCLHVTDIFHIRNLI